MSKYLLFLFVFVISIKLPAQIVKEQKRPAIEIDYLKKSHRQKVAAWSFLGGGFLLIIISSKMRNTYIRNGDYYSNQFLPNTMTIAGGLSMVGSIPLFIASARNKGRALGTSVGIKMQAIINNSKGMLAQECYPVLSLKIIYN
jgi:ATP/ADP translocase